MHQSSSGSEVSVGACHAINHTLKAFKLTLLITPCILEVEKTLTQSEIYKALHHVGHLFIIPLTC